MRNVGVELLERRVGLVDNVKHKLTTRHHLRSKVHIFSINSKEAETENNNNKTHLSPDAEIVPRIWQALAPRRQSQLDVVDRLISIRSERVARNTNDVFELDERLKDRQQRLFFG